LPIAHLLIAIFDMPTSEVILDTPMISGSSVRIAIPSVGTVDLNLCADLVSMDFGLKTASPNISLDLVSEEPYPPVTIINLPASEITSLIQAEASKNLFNVSFGFTLVS
jgi:hypothetical protein